VPESLRARLEFYLVLKAMKNFKEDKADKESQIQQRGQKMSQSV